MAISKKTGGRTKGTLPKFDKLQFGLEDDLKSM